MIGFDAFVPLLELMILAIIGVLIFYILYKLAKSRISKPVNENIREEIYVESRDEGRTIPLKISYIYKNANLYRVLKPSTSMLISFNYTPEKPSVSKIKKWVNFIIDECKFSGEIIFALDDKLDSENTEISAFIKNVTDRGIKTEVFRGDKTQIAFVKYIRIPEAKVDGADQFVREFEFIIPKAKQGKEKIFNISSDPKTLIGYMGIGGMQNIFWKGPMP